VMQKQGLKCGWYLDKMFEIGMKPSQSLVDISLVVRVNKKSATKERGWKVKSDWVELKCTPGLYPFLTCEAEYEYTHNNVFKMKSNISKLMSFRVVRADDELRIIANDMRESEQDQSSLSRETAILEKNVHLKSGFQVEDYRNLSNGDAAAMLNIMDIRKLASPQMIVASCVALAFVGFASMAVLARSRRAAVVPSVRQVRADVIEMTERESGDCA